MDPKNLKSETSKELYQHGVIQLRLSDQIRVVQNGIEKLLLISSVLDTMRDMIIDTVPGMLVSYHTHSETDIINLITNLTTLTASIAGKALLSHSHSESDITNLINDLASKSPISHSHLESDITSLTTDLAAKAALTHSHPESDITNLISDLAGKVALSHTHLVADIASDFVDATSGTAIAKNGAFVATAKATAVTGNVVFQFTTNGLSSGTAIFPNGPFSNSEIFRAEDGTNPAAFGVAVWSNSNKTLTVPMNRVGTAVTLLGISVLGATIAANGTVVYATVWGR